MSMTAFLDYDSDSAPTLYPSSCPSSDSEDESCRPRASDTILRSSIASLPDSKLRSIMIKLAGSNPQFHRAIMKELAQSDDDSPPLTPTNQWKSLVSHRNRGRRSRKSLSLSTQFPLVPKARCVSLSSTLGKEELVYHPGHLSKEVYEFLSAPTADIGCNVLRTVTMWSCCDEDEWSPGCAVAAISTEDRETPRDRDLEGDLAHQDVLPDSDLEKYWEDTPRQLTHRPSQDFP
ncbi:hypothetical protein CVT26_013362 [Gymnopilus dilepis]|uniref:Uncharacterized protein n=1 Tax=Gymnopilus dilepis TaxID=231916 RepID=A0A409WDD3_9AGAR|nr:hypothetical protein CVT26_013362 [Gymnopilus dilepis]